MAFSFTWLGFSALVLLGMLLYNTSFRLAGDSLNPFVFTMILTITALLGHIVLYVLYKIYGADSISLFGGANKSYWYPIMAGLGVVIVDLALFFAIRHGGLMNTTLFWSVLSPVLIAVFSYFVFKEGINLEKVVAIVLGLISITLLIRSNT